MITDAAVGVLASLTLLAAIVILTLRRYRSYFLILETVHVHARGNIWEGRASRAGVLEITFMCDVIVA
jgi:hypothetical protein